MDEMQRIAYLKHMGVEQYYSRYVLVGAKASVIPAAAQDIYDPEGSQQLPAKTRQAEPPRSELDVKPGSDAGKRHGAIAAEEVETRHQRQVRPAEAETGSAETGRAETGRAEIKRAESERAETGKEQIPGESLRFSVQFFRVNAQLAVINEAPHEAGGRENQQATSLLTMYANGQLNPVVTQTFPKEQFVEAFNIFTKRQAKGKVTLEFKAE